MGDHTKCQVYGSYFLARFFKGRLGVWVRVGKGRVDERRCGVFLNNRGTYLGESEDMTKRVFREFRKVQRSQES